MLLKIMTHFSWVNIMYRKRATNVVQRPRALVRASILQTNGPHIEYERVFHFFQILPNK